MKTNARLLVSILKTEVSILPAISAKKYFPIVGIKNKGHNLYADKYHLLFDRPSVENSKLTIGIPRALGMYRKLSVLACSFSACGIRSGAFRRFYHEIVRKRT